MAKTKVAVISNANAGKNTSRAGLGNVIGNILATPRYNFSTESLSHLDKVAKDLNRDRPDILVIVGGDGTLQQTITRVLNEHSLTPKVPLPMILPVATGTVRVVATALGLTRVAPDRLAEKMAAKLRAGEPFNTAYLSPLHEEHTSQYSFLSGSGLPVNLLTEYYKDPIRGPRGTLRVLSQTFLNELWSLLTFRKSREILTRPVHAKITLPEGHNPPVAPYMSHTSLFVSCVDEVGYGCRAMPDASSTPGHFMLRSSRLSFWGYIASVGAIWAGLPLASTFDAVVPRVVIDYQEPTIITVDGELNKPTMQNVFSSGPRLTFITG